MTTTENNKGRQATNQAAVMQEMSGKIRVLEAQLSIVSSQRDAAMNKTSELAATATILAQDFDALKKATEKLREDAIAEIGKLSKENEELRARLADHDPEENPNPNIKIADVE